ncbi:MAG: hypothetical protein FJW34_18160 [Acidobacteria bacterium]|nr:hypothetical protein [Acidobacteriota bacterium]
MATFSAEDGALHESEYLTPVGRGRKRLGFQGYVLLSEGLDARQVTEVLRTCQVGADRRYGWGRLQLLGELEECGRGELFGCVRSNGSYPGRGPVLESCVAAPWYLPAHLECEAANYEQFEGELEALSGRDWCGERGPGKKVVKAKLCWAPGSRARPSKAPLRFWIEPQGVWRSAGGDCAGGGGGGSMADPL